MDFVKQAFAALFVLLSSSTCISQVPSAEELLQEQTGMTQGESADDPAPAPLGG